MYKQETIFYPDTFQIHITKDYVNDILVEEKHYTLDNITYYYINYTSNYMFKRFFFHNEELSKKYTTYFYILTRVDDDYPTIKLYTEIDGITFENKVVNKKYIMTHNTCTQLCTLENDEAIKFIQNYIKIQILEE
jgi:hypothetical protein